jgi:predicted transcriptional regulator of viral defense system
MASNTDRERTLRLTRRRERITARELAAAGIHRQTVSRLVASGELKRVVRGVYRLPGHPQSEHTGLAIVGAVVPQGVICLLSALQFHGIGTQVPSEVWIAIDRKARRPSLRYPPLRVLRFSGAALTEGVEIKPIDGQMVRIYNVAKTVVDCFKYRNKIGLDVALEALREARAAKMASAEALWHYAKIDRVTNVMRPYLESVE